jgi:hypothetical protein
VVQVALAVQVAQVAHRVPVVALHVQVAFQAVHVLLAQALHVRVAAPQAALRVQLRVDSLAQVAAQAQAVVAVLAVEPLVPSVRAAHAVRARLVSQSVQSAKSSNSAAMRHHLVAHLYLAVMEPRFYVSVAAHRSKTSQTRLTPMRVS